MKIRFKEKRKKKITCKDDLFFTLLLYPDPPQLD